MVPFWKIDQSYARNDKLCQKQYYQNLSKPYFVGVQHVLYMLVSSSCGSSIW